MSTLNINGSFYHSYPVSYSTYPVSDDAKSTGYSDMPGIEDPNKLNGTEKECQTCKNRKYQDGSDEANVSFKTAQHISPEAASGGNIGKIVDGDIIEIDIPNRSINVKLSDEELASRPMTPVTRNRVVSKSLRAYASMVSSADKGGVRIID